MNKIQNVLDRLNNLWGSAGRHPYETAMGFWFLGFVLCVWSFGINVHSVKWDGYVEGHLVTGMDAGVVKQVGFALAPNWGVTTFLLIPLTVLFLCQARGAIDETLNRLIARDLLRPVGDSTITHAEFLEKWRIKSRNWMAICVMVFTVAFVIIVFLDFVPVVFRWLWNEGYAATQLTNATIAHPVYEFDWSIAAILNKPGEVSDIGRISNMIFSFAAYFSIAVLGAGFILATFMWSMALCSFLNPKNLASMGYVIVPDVKCKDRRAGFEVFEAYFGFLLLASLMTAVLALGMHLQNVYLRAPAYSNVYEMMFGASLEAIHANISFSEWQKVLSNLVSFNKALNQDTFTMENLQSMITMLALFLITMVVIFAQANMIATLARHGRGWLRDNEELTAPERRRLKRMKMWPVRWMSPLFFLVMIGLIVVAMFYVNFLTVVLVLLVVKGIAVVAQNMLAEWRGDEDDDDD